MARGSRKRRRATLTRARRGRNSFIWYVLAGVIIVVGVVLIVMSRDGEQAPIANRDHWHAAFGVNVCGEWLPDVPEFHTAAGNPNLTAGIHSHGDGLIHIHPFVSGEAGERATVGKYFEYAGYDASADSFTMSDGATHQTGDECDGEPAQVRWSLNGVEQGGNISSYHPKDQDVIALALLPEDAEIGEPPSTANLAAPNDLVDSTVPGESTGTTAPAATDTTAPAATETTAPASTGTTAPAATGTTAADASATETTVDTTTP
jgi:hypothetical protein